MRVVLKKERIKKAREVVLKKEIIREAGESVSEEREKMRGWRGWCWRSIEEKKGGW